MGRDNPWQPLVDELDRWKGDGRKARFWLRDDDAVAPTPALERLLSLGRRFDMPLALAVIPAFAGQALAERLAGEDGVCVAVHGWSHENHAPDTEKKQELGPHRPADVVLSELRAGSDRLRALFAGRLVPVLVPPWNRIAPAWLPALPAAGFAALSVYGRAGAGGGLPRINTHVDIMDWHGTRGGREHAVLVDELVLQLRARPPGDDEPIGILTHHLVHDGTAWAFLEGLAASTADHPAAVWSPVANLFPAKRS